MAVEFRVISIGAMSHHILWGERSAVRPAHATTTLVADGERRILVDPALPGDLLAAKLFERTGRGPESITDVFCTTLRPDGRRGLETFAKARWWCGQKELDAYRRQLAGLVESAERLDDQAAAAARAESELLKRIAPAPEKFTEQVGLYPLFGATVGCCGLLLTPPTQTVVVAGPAVPSREHAQRGMVWEQCDDRQAAMDSLGDLLELADVIVPGYDNVIVSPRRWM